MNYEKKRKWLRKKLNNKERKAIERRVAKRRESDFVALEELYPKSKKENVNIQKSM